MKEMKEMKTILNGRYSVSEDGDVYNNDTGKKLVACNHIYNLYSEGERIGIRKNQLVAQTFVPNPENKKYVLPKDGNAKNCHKDNLMWSNSFYKSHACLVFHDESGMPHFFKSRLDFSKKSGITSGSTVSALIRGDKEREGEYYSQDYIRKQIQLLADKDSKETNKENSKEEVKEVKEDNTYNTYNNTDKGEGNEIHIS